MKGIDVSSHQGYIDFRKVKNAGIDFVIIRMACGTTIDKDFFKNYHSAKANGLKVGAYIFTLANTSPKVIDEVNAIRNELDKYVEANEKALDLDLPFFIDVEYDTIVKTSKNNVSWLFDENYNRYKKLFSKVGLYASSSILETKFRVDILDSVPVWVAEWDNNLDYKGPFIFWQYSNKGRISGIETDVDLNNTDRTLSDAFTHDTLINELADRVLKGEFGNGETRKEILGVIYSEVQNAVNKKLTERRY